MKRCKKLLVGALAVVAVGVGNAWATNFDNGCAGGTSWATNTAPTLTFNGSDRSGDIVATCAGESITNGTDYTVTFDGGADGTTVGTHGFTITPAGSHTGTDLTGTLTISKKDVTVNIGGLSVTTREYNETTSATVTGTLTASDVSGLESGYETVTVTVPTDWVFDDADVGATKTVESATGFSLGGAHGGNYNITTAASLTGTITPAIINAITITGLDVPVTGGIPDASASSSTPGVTVVGAINWAPVDDLFNASTVYTATIALTRSSTNYEFPASIAGTNITVTGATTKTFTQTDVASGTLEVAFPATTLIITPPTGLPNLTTASACMLILLALSLGLWGYVGRSYVVSRRKS